MKDRNIKSKGSREKHIGKHEQKSINRNQTNDRENNKAKSCFFEMINENDKYLARTTQERGERERIQITNIRNKRRDFTINLRH